MKENLFCDKELQMVLKGLEKNKASEADSVVNWFLKFGGFWFLKFLVENFN